MSLLIFICFSIAGKSMTKSPTMCVDLSIYHFSSLFCLLYIFEAMLLNT